jgi:hypothetical protein
MWRTGAQLDVCGWCTSPLVLLGEEQHDGPNPFVCPRCDRPGVGHAIDGDGIRAAPR